MFCAGPRPSVSGDVGDGTGCPLLVQLVSERQEEDLEREAEMIAAAGMPFTLVAVPVRDWELELMPWAEPAVSKRPEVGTGAGETLRYLERGLLARDNGTQAASLRNTPPVILGGYSLAGLFALWAASQTDRFGAVVAGSPSLWAGNWPGYAAGHAMQARQVYLSLGDREERSRNKTFARVGDRCSNSWARRTPRWCGRRAATSPTPPPAWPVASCGAFQRTIPPPAAEILEIVEIIDSDGFQRFTLAKSWKSI